MVQIAFKVDLVFSFGRMEVQGIGVEKDLV
jgi:hypothetical protein